MIREAYEREVAGPERVEDMSPSERYRRDLLPKVGGVLLGLAGCSFIDDEWGTGVAADISLREGQTKSFNLDDIEYHVLLMRVSEGEDSQKVVDITIVANAQTDQQTNHELSFQYPSQTIEFENGVPRVTSTVTI